MTGMDQTPAGGAEAGVDGGIASSTLSAARAGDMGRGFAVVASEVKNLANQAKQATDKIAEEIGSLIDTIDQRARIFVRG